jgi:hypothetical protein
LILVIGSTGPGFFITAAGHVIRGDFHGKGAACPPTIPTTQPQMIAPTFRISYPRPIKWMAGTFSNAHTLSPSRKPNSSQAGRVTKATSGKPQSKATRTIGPSTTRVRILPSSRLRELN